MNSIVTPRVAGKNRLTRMIVAPMFLLAWVITLAFSATAHAAPRWIEGPLFQGPPVFNCITQQLGFGVSSYVQYLGDPEGRRPAAGDTYYIGVIFQNAANICLGYAGVTVKLQLPPNTVPAIDATNQVFCFVDARRSSCPQSLVPQSDGTLAYYPDPSDPIFKVANGSVIELQFPVRSSAPLNGAALTAILKVADGTSPLYDETPQVPVWVFGPSNAPPAVTSIVRAGASPTSATTLTWTVTFSEPVSGVDASDFGLLQSGITGSTIASVAPAAGPAATYTVTVTRGSGTGSIRLDLLDNDSIRDADNAPLGGPGQGNGTKAGEDYAITAPNVPPTVSSIVRAGISPTSAATIAWTVTFSEPVSGVDPSDFRLGAGGVTGASIVGVSPGSGTATTYQVTVATGTGSGALTLALADNDSIKDAAGASLGGTGQGNGNMTGETYIVRPPANSPPTVTSIVRTGPATTNASFVAWTVTFSEPVSGVDASDFRLAASGISNASIQSVAPGNATSTTFTVTASTGTGNGTLGLRLVDDDSIRNAAGAALGGAGSGNGDATGEVYTLQRAPTGIDMNQHGLTGSWYEHATSGQGFLIEVFPDLLAPGKGVIAGSWFTFDAPPAGNATKQRWYTFSGPVLSGQRNVELALYLNTGGNFDAGPVTNAVPIGSVVLDFADCANGSVAYTFTDGSGRTGAIPITRLTPNVTCSATAARPTNPDFAYSGNWFEPATSGQGFLIEVNPAARALFFAWYTYAPQGQAQGISGQRWYTGLGTFEPGSRVIEVTLYETTGGVFDASPPAPVTLPIGTATVTFAGCNSARLSYDFQNGSSAGRVGTIDLVRVASVPAGCGP